MLDYSDDVKKQLNALERTGIATTDAIDNMKSELSNVINSSKNEIQGFRSDVQAAAVGLYNQGQDIRNNLQMNTYAIRNMSLGISSDIQESTYKIVASQTMLAENFKQGFNAVNNTLDFGFSLVGNKIEVLSEEVSSKLDEIHDILNNPRLTESRELYREALRSYQKGYFEEALEDCKGAVEKNKTDFISWYLLGMIYLFGAGKFSNVIDLDKAEEAFFNAAKYIDSDLGQSEEANLFASEIYYYLGYTRLIISNEKLIENKLDDSYVKLLEAEKGFSMSYNFSKENLKAGYEDAKALHFLVKDDEALLLLEELIRKNKNFAIKAINDKNFESLKKKIETLILKLRDEVVNKIIQQCNDFRAMYNIEDKQDILSRIEIPSETEINEFENFYFEDFLSDYHHTKSNFREICEDFNDLVKDISKQKCPYLIMNDIACCEPVINNIRKGKIPLQKKLDKMLLQLKDTLNSFETIQERDYFFVLQKDIEFNGNMNQDRLRSVSYAIKKICNNFDNELKTFNNDIQCINIWFAAQREWKTRKLELRDKYIGEITKKCSRSRLDWKNRIEKMKNDLDDNCLLAKSSEIISHTKSILSDELNIILSRIDIISKFFAMEQEMDYFDVLEKYIKFNESQLTNTNSYFEYTICSLSNEIEILKDSALNLMETK